MSQLYFVNECESISEKNVERENSFHSIFYLQNLIHKILLNVGRQVEFLFIFFKSQVLHSIFVKIHLRQNSQNSQKSLKTVGLDHSEIL